MQIINVYVARFGTSHWISRIYIYSDEKRLTRVKHLKVMQILLHAVL